MKKVIFIFFISFVAVMSLSAQRGGHYHGHHSGYHNHHYSHHNHYVYHQPGRPVYHQRNYYNGWRPVCISDFNLGCRTIRRCRYDRDRLRAAKRFVACHHLTVQQIQCIMNMFAYERNRLDFAKYAYGRTCDRYNYNQLYRCFAYQASCRNLDIYIRGF